MTHDFSTWIVLSHFAPFLRNPVRVEAGDSKGNKTKCLLREQFNSYKFLVHFVNSPLTLFVFKGQRHTH